MPISDTADEDTCLYTRWLQQQHKKNQERVGQVKEYMGQGTVIPLRIAHSAHGLITAEPQANRVLSR